MRMSKRALLIETAIDIVEKHGLNHLTYESLAAATGLSKSGLIYHFPSRDALLRAMHEQLAHTWEQEMIAAAGGTAENIDERTRVRASFIVMSQSATLSDLRLALDAVGNPTMQEPWLDVMRRWSVSEETITKIPRLYLLNVIADGLWVHDHVNGFVLTDQQRTALVSSALALYDECVPPH
ncbi:transcriptional regulator, TetR family [Corynebacterium mustelae]|uniref:Transcriptional regulator, TetR family n=2 Tax=Corynebacterium mustelae TaxID=571915 RepID=A0A0G3H0H4_9CORY|nr:transcriptional regulator, TetR family [Corynebacterium mustelae]